MTPQRPIELVNASKACAEAWLKRDAMIDAGDKEGVKAMDLTCDLLQERYNSIYRQWQELGGTSNIDSITFPPEFVDGFCDDPSAMKSEEAANLSLVWHSLTIDLSGAVDNATRRSAELKARIDARMAAAKERNKGQYSPLK